jgi:16S rRNA (uracil1498-N3)-methyltransferase
VSEPLFLVAELPGVGAYRLEGPEGRHAADVVRMRAGESLLLSDGRGGLVTAVVTAPTRGTVEVQVIRRMPVPAPEHRLVVVQGIAKGDRGELAVQAMSEVGVDEIVPWSAARSVVQWLGERGERAHARWQATAREASKQARRAWLPTVAPAATTTATADRLAAAAAAFVLHEEATERLSAVRLPDSGEICLVVGPEGGIAEDEVDRFTAAGAVPVRLGPTVLRTSTAGVAAIALLSARLGRW